MGLIAFFLSKDNKIIPIAYISILLVTFWFVNTSGAEHMGLQVGEKYSYKLSCTFKEIPKSINLISPNFSENNTFSKEISLWIIF